ncbi:folylpolyglutamate synthase, mitochondrial isoform X2 [Aethina tumida]|uniref:folylpolyglutamate synthase, mitochondrial isoform X2 n=1 Tax=Aethina tumida TaxID=116153 RepID=UPI002148CE57|nr:folylpolyglutamate synthase, mitochondrial isoform X2 [Aethina tumida]
MLCKSFTRTVSLFSVKKTVSEKMTTNIQQEYEAAVSKLNSLQSNAHYIQEYGKKSKETQHRHHSALETRKFLERSGMSLDKLDNLSVIHVAGTKGKGTTCAFSESILRHHGYKTGFFSSPHLLEVRERIRINGRPIEKQDFVKFFWKIYNTLNDNKSHENDMPLYFGFMTVMAFHVFVEKKVDVAIIEVGIGGAYDCTNALRKTDVAGITSLGIDHTTLLGDTIESIAWNKAGIMKSGCKTFTVPQVDSAMKVLKEESAKKQSQLEVVNVNYSLNESLYPSDIINLNANLALALCKSWIENSGNNNGKRFSLELAIIGVETCTWPGRFEMRKRNKICYFLDGAHTMESINVCNKWFSEKTKNSKKKKALMFNLTGERDSETILKELHKQQFDLVAFVPNQSISDSKSDKQLKRCEEHMMVWLKLNENELNTSTVKVFTSVLNSIEYLEGTKQEYDLLVTGSLHLIGAVLGVLDPNLRGTLS